MRIYYQFKEEDSQNFVGTSYGQFKEENQSAFSSLADGTSITISQDYNALKNKPQINSVELIGSVSLPMLGLRAIYYDTTANWNRQMSLIAEEGAIYIYSDYTSYSDEIGNTVSLAGIKIGDGKAYLADIPFVTDALTSFILEHVNNKDVHITPQERTFWNNKVSSYVDPESIETLVLSKTHYELEGEIHYG